MNSTKTFPFRIVPLLTTVMVGLTLTILGCSFLMSFHALAHGATSIGSHPAHLAWCFPLMLDLAILMPLAAGVIRKLRRERGRLKGFWYGALVLVFSGTSGFLNMYQDVTLAPVAVAAWLPLVYNLLPVVLLFTSAEALKDVVEQLAGERVEVEEKRDREASQRAKQKASKASKKKMPLEERRAWVRSEHERLNGNFNRSEIAAKAGVHRQQISRDLTALGLED